MNPHCSLYIGTSHQPFGPILVTLTLLPSSSAIIVIHTLYQLSLIILSLFNQEIETDHIRTVINNHLLSAPYTLRFILTTIHRRFRCSKWGCRSRVGDVAFETLHVHVRLAAVIRHPEPGTCAAGGGTGGEGGGDGVGC